MKSTMRTNILIFVGSVLLIISSLGYCARASWSNEIDYAEENFSIKVSNNWSRFSADDVASFDTGDENITVVDGFQLHSDKPMEMLPHIIIYSNKAGKLDADVLLESKEAEIYEYMQAMADQINESSSADMKLPEPATEIVWDDNIYHYEDVGDVRLVSAFCLTDTGWIEFTLAVKPEQYSDYIEDLIRIANSIRFKKIIGYKTEPIVSETEDAENDNLYYPKRTALFTINHLFSFFPGSLKFSLYVLIAIFPLWLRKKDAKKKEYTEQMDADGNPMKEYRPSADDISKNQQITALFIKVVISLILCLLPFVCFFLNSILGYIPTYPIGLSWNSAIFVAAVCLFAKLYQQIVASTYSIYLSDNYIMKDYGNGVITQLNRCEILAVEEGLIQLDVIVKGKERCLSIPKDIESYEEIKSKLFGWLNYTL